MNTSLLTTILQWVLTALLSAAIASLAAIFVAIGFVGGVVLAAWQEVETVDLGQLDYHESGTWKQHLEIYSSVCIVQRTDSIDFVLKKLARLEYEASEHPIPSTPGQYSAKLDASNTGQVWIYLQGFHFPRGDQTPYWVKIKVRTGTIESIQEYRDEDAIRNGRGENTPTFALRPELINELYDEGGEARELVPLVKMPDKLLGAFLAVEDRRFYQHWGVDVQGIIRALIRNLKVKDGTLHGGSTITQQLTRNIYLSLEQLYLRKIKEALLAVRIESRFSKDEILERYLNFINLGRYGSRDVLGVQEAAKSYFGKPVWELNYQECATLAGVPKSPTRYSPVRYPDRAKGRRNLVLVQMRDAGYITEQEYEESITQPLYVEGPQPAETRDASHFLDYVHHLLSNDPKLKDQLYNQGLKVYTTVDISMQRLAEQAVAEHLRQLDQELRTNDSAFWTLPDYDVNKMNPNGIDPIQNYLQAALVAIEPQTGFIKAMVGGRDYYITRQQINFFNRAAQAVRQPGSAFKPIVYTAMLEKLSLAEPLATPATIIRDEAWGTEGEPGKIWSPKNYMKMYYGDVTLREMLERSINVATAKLMWETPFQANSKPEGLNRTLDLARRLGIQSRLNPYPSLSLGASGVTPLELTAAYAVLANQGLRTEPVAIEYIEDRHGEILVENKIEHQRVLDENVAYLITHLMEGVINNSSYGTGRRARAMGLTRAAAGKTGTTNDFTDAWFVGYLPNFAVGVWVGFDDPKMSTTKTGAAGALPIWARFMVEGARGPTQDFRPPSGVVFLEIDKETGLRRSPQCSEENVIFEAFLEGYEPKRLCDAHY